MDILGLVIAIQTDNKEIDIMFIVLDNSKPAKFPEHKVHSSWDNNQFETFEEAKEYADKWLGMYGPYLLDTAGGYGYDYSGYGDVIKIIEIE